MAINLDVHGNTRPLEASVQAAISRIRRKPIKITIDEKGVTQPLGNMKRSADEFGKSMEAANARILAFGASMAIINGVADAFKGMVRNLVDVEKSLADINVVMGLTTQNLEKFSDGLFKVAKETGAAFKVAADAATEYARQGLSVEESLRRTRDALVLTRLTGMDSAEAVKSLTAAMNIYGKQIKDTTQLVSKFAAVDVQFAVSAEDFAAAISRTGQAAKTAGVSIDELIGIVTSAQQQTARGGAVIGNALKTIFTKTGRSDTLNQLENLGIAVRDLEGNTLGAKKILTDLAHTFDTLSEAQKSQITQTMGGLFHINILKAVLSDAAKENSILARATEISSSATDEAIQKNKQLRETMSAMATETGLAIQELSVKIGELMLAPGMEKILNAVKSIAEGANDILGDGESAGSKFASGFLQGLGNVITGPGLVVITTVFVKLFMTAAKFTKESLQSLIGVTNEAQKQKAIQTSILTLLGQNSNLYKEMLRSDISRVEKEQVILGLLQKQNLEAIKLQNTTKFLASSLYGKGYSANLVPTGRGARSASGYIPNFADPERAQAAQGGYAAGSIRTMNMPGQGPVIYNSAETVKNFPGLKQPAIMPPQSSKAGKNYQQAFGSIHGFDPYAAGGYIPNYALAPFNSLRGTAGLKKFSAQQGVDEEQAYNMLLKYQNDNKSFTNLTSSQLMTQYSGSKKQSIAAMLVPPEGYSGRAYANHTDTTWPVYALRPDAQTDPSLTGMVESDFKKTGSKYASRLSTILHGKNVTPNEFWKTMQSDTAGGAKGAWMAAVGALFEAAVNSALDYKAAVAAPEEADFDVRGGNLTLFRKAFDGFPDGMNLADYKSDDRSSKNRKSFRDKVVKQKKFIEKQRKSKLRAAYGYIPNFSAMTISRLGGLGKSKFSLATVINSNPYFEQLLKRYGHWKNFPPQEKTKLNKFLLKQGFTNRTLQGYGLASMHGKSIGEGISNIAAASGHIPNFANPLSDAIGREKAAGVPVSQIRVGSHSALMSKGNPLGLGVTNTHDEPNGLKDVFGAKGSVPNYAKFTDPLAIRGGFQMRDLKDAVIGTKNPTLVSYESSIKSLTKNVQSYQNQLKVLTVGTEQHTNVRKKLMSSEQRLNAKIKEKEALLTSQPARSGGLMGGISSLNSRFSNTSAGRLLQGNAGMGLMIGAPMLAAAFQSEDKTDGMAAGMSGAMMGVGTGASIGMMFGPLGIAIGAAAGGLIGFMSGLNEAEKAAREKAKADREAAKKDFVQGAMSIISGKIDPSQTLGTKSGFVSELKNKNGGSAFVGKSMVEIAETLAAFSSSTKDKDDLYKNLNENFSAKDTRDIMSGRSKAQKSFLAEAFRGREKEVFRGKEKLSKFGINKETATGEEIIQAIFQADGAKIKALLNAYKNDLQERTNKEKEVTKGVILQLDFQKLAIAAANKAKSAQMDISNSFAKISQSLNLQAKLMGGYTTEQQKVNMKYTQAVMAATQKYASEARASQDKYASNVLSVSKNEEVSRLLKKELRMGEDAKVQDVTEEFAKLELEEQVNILKEILPIGDRYRKELENHGYEHEKNLRLYAKQLQYSKDLAESEKDITSESARRADIIKDMQNKLQSQRTSAEHNQIMRGFNSQLTQASLGAGAPGGFLSSANQESYNIAIKRFETQQKMLSLEENYNLKLKEQEIIAQKIKMENEEYLALKQKESTLTGNDLTRFNALVDTANERKRLLDESLTAQYNITQQRDAELSTTRALLAIEIERANARKEMQQEYDRINFQEYRNQTAQTLASNSSQISTLKMNTMMGPGYIPEFQRRQIELAQKRKDLPDQQLAINQKYDNQRDRLNASLNFSQEARDNERQAELMEEVGWMRGKSEEEIKMNPFVQKEDLEDLKELELLKANEESRNETLDRIREKLEDNKKLRESELKLVKEQLAQEELRLANEKAYKTGAGAFGNGLSEGFKKMREQTELLDFELAQRIPGAFADGLANAFSEALSGAKSLDEALTDAAIGFLQMIQKAMMQKAAMNIVGMMPFSSGGNVRKYNNGGSVPAMVSNGEYVMGRDAVNKYGGSFMHGLNAGGNIPAYNNGGKLEGFQFKSGKAYQKKKMSGDFYGRKDHIGLQADSRSLEEALSEKERAEAEAVQKAFAEAAEDNAKIMSIIQTVAGVAVSAGISHFSGKFGAGKNAAALKKAGVPSGSLEWLKSQGMSGDTATDLLLSGSNMSHPNYQASRAILDDLSGGNTTYLTGLPRREYFGGPIRNYASGGYISGKSGIDQIPAMLSEGEYVIRASSARQIGKPMLDRINSGKFNDGGPVDKNTTSSQEESSGNTNNINISINIEGSSVKGQSGEAGSGGAEIAAGDNKKEGVKAFSEKIKQQIVSVIVEEQRPGGLLSK